MYSADPSPSWRAYRHQASGLAETNMTAMSYPMVSTMSIT
jgi:hypothetical protein